MKIATIFNYFPTQQQESLQFCSRLATGEWLNYVVYRTTDSLILFLVIMGKLLLYA